MPYRYYNYFTEIEEYFVRRRGKHLLVSPLDWSLIESWKQMGIPLHVVFRGIDAAFEKRKPQQPTSRINSIFYCQPAVMECFEAHQQAMVGQAEEGGEQERSRSADKADKVVQSLARFQTELEQAAVRFPSPETLNRVQEILGELRREQESNPGLSSSAVESSLQTCDKLLLEACRAHLPDEAKTEMEKEAARQLKIYKRRVSAEMYRLIRQNFLNRGLREHYGLPEFTLFFLS